MSQDPVLTQTRDQRCEIAVRSHDAEAINLALIKQIDCINGYRHIGGILAFANIKLLQRANTGFIGDLVPFCEIVLSEIAVGVSNVHLAQLGHYRQGRIDTFRSGVVCVDQLSDIYGF